MNHWDSSLKSFNASMLQEAHPALPGQCEPAYIFHSFVAVLFRADSPRQSPSLVKRPAPAECRPTLFQLACACLPQAGQANPCPVPPSPHTVRASRSERLYGARRRAGSTPLPSTTLPSTFAQDGERQSNPKGSEQGPSLTALPFDPAQGPESRRAGSRGERKPRGRCCAGQKWAARGHQPETLPVQFRLNVCGFALERISTGNSQRITAMLGK
jgi:hypothetical protein